jgi:nucleoside-diphosphate-sugar epimerase
VSWFPDEKVYVGNLFDPLCLARAVEGVDTVIHVPPLAQPEGNGRRQLDVHRWAHVESTRLLLEKAVIEGVKKFLYVSSAHVMGQSTDKPLCELTAGTPGTPYAQAKMEAEDLILFFAERYGIEPVILRPPSIYGFGDKSIVSALSQAALRNLWLPFKGVDALHSLVFVETLARAGVALLRDVENESKNRIFIVKDLLDYRPERLYRAVCKALEKEPRLFWAPSPLMTILKTVGGKFRNVPKLGWMNLIRQLLIPQRYCGHLFEETLPTFAYVGLDEAVRRSLNHYQGPRVFG